MGLQQQARRRDKAYKQTALITNFFLSVINFKFVFPNIFAESGLELKKLESPLDTHFFSSAYEALLKGEPIELRPRLKHGAGITYDFFGIDVPEEKLRYYLERGFLEVAGEVAFPACPVCGEVRLNLKIRCPNCRSSNIEKRDLMIHYDCGYLGPVESFETGEPGVYRCPKCGKTLKKVGIDYGRPGFGFVCRDCNAVFQVPLIEVECPNGHKSSIQSLEIKKYPVYRVSEEVRKFAEIHDAVNRLSELLMERGVRSEPFASVKGISGEKHRVPLYVELDPPVIVEILTPSIIDDRSLIGVAIRALDIPEAITLLVLPREIETDLEKIFNPEKVRVMKVDNLKESINEILDSILMLRA